MAVSRWDPLRELLSLQQRVNQLFESTLSRSHGDDKPSSGSGAWTPPVDIYEASDRVILRADLPGVRQEDIDVRIENNALVLRGERHLHADSRREDYLRIERPLGSFTRSFSLPPSVNRAEVRAEFRNGVLEITLSKKREAQARSVKVDVR